MLGTAFFVSPAGLGMHRPAVRSAPPVNDSAHA